MRNAIAGTLDFLNRNIQIIQTVDNIETPHKVKFYYNFGQDEQFMKDFFVNLDHGCIVHKAAEGNFDVRPIGVIKYTSFAIRPNDMTNRFVRGTFLNEGYTDNMEKMMSAYSAYLMRLPMTIKIDVDVQTDNLGQSMSVMEAILTAIYKSNVMYFQYRGLRVPSEILMGDGIDLDKKTEFTYDDQQTAHCKFSLDVNTTFPIFDDNSVARKSQIIREFRMSLENEQSTINGSTYIEDLVTREFEIMTVPYDYKNQ